MKPIKFLLIALFFSSCSLIQEPKMFCEREIQQYLDTYIQESNKRGVSPNVDNYSITFEYDLYVGATKAAGSAVKKNGVVIIKIDTDWWNNASDLEKEVLFIHEAGHGFLDYRHDVNKIMKTNKSKYVDYKTERELMLNEFFNANIK